MNGEYSMEQVVLQLGHLDMGHETHDAQYWASVKWNWITLDSKDYMHAFIKILSFVFPATNGSKQAM